MIKRHWIAHSGLAVVMLFGIVLITGLTGCDLDPGEGVRPHEICGKSPPADFSSMGIHKVVVYTNGGSVARGLVQSCAETKGYEVELRGMGSIDYGQDYGYSLACRDNVKAIEKYIANDPPPPDAQALMFVAVRESASLSGYVQLSRSTTVLEIEIDFALCDLTGKRIVGSKVTTLRKLRSIAGWEYTTAESEEALRNRAFEKLFSRLPPCPSSVSSSPPAATQP